MVEKAMKVLEEIIRNDEKTEEEILKSVYEAFPNMSQKTLEGYIYELERKGYIVALEGDNEIIAIHIKPIAYSVLDRAKIQPQETKTQSHTFNIGQIHGQIAMGNSGGNYELNMSNVFHQAVNEGLREAITAAEKQKLEKSEREEIKTLLNEILKSLEKSEAPPQNLISRISALFQKHSWIAAPIATKILNALTKLF